MHCPNCLGRKPPYKIQYHWPWFLFPLRLFVDKVRCNTCLVIYYRIKPLGVLIRAD